MGFLTALPGIIGAAGAVDGGIKGSQSQSSDNNALNQLLGDSTGTIDQITKSIFGQGGTLSNMGSLLSSFMNFQGLTPTQIGALTQGQVQGGQSAINSFKSQVGGVANPAALIQTLTNQNNQSGQQTALQLGAQAQQSQLGALQGASGLLSSQLGMLSPALSSLSGDINTVGNAAASNPNPWGNAFSGVSSALSSIPGL